MVLYPIIQSVARRYGQGDQYEAMITDDEPIVLPRGASEVEVKTRQVGSFYLRKIKHGQILGIILTVNRLLCSNI